MIDVSLFAGLASLGLCLATGIWVGYRYAVESRRMDAVIAHALAKADTDWEDEVPCRRPDPHPVCACLSSDPWSRAASGKADPDWGDWEVDKWWGRNA